MEFQFTESLSNCETSVSKWAPAGFRVLCRKGAHWKRRRHGPPSAHLGLGTWEMIQSRLAQGTELDSLVPIRTDSSPAHPKRTATCCGGVGGSEDRSSARGDWDIPLLWPSSCIHKHNNTVHKWKKSQRHYITDWLPRSSDSLKTFSYKLAFQHWARKATKTTPFAVKIFSPPSLTDYSDGEISAFFQCCHCTPAIKWYWLEIVCLHLLMLF